MEQRCVLCGELISAEEVSGAIEYALWDAGLRKGDWDEETGHQPPEEANWNVTNTDRWGWVHYDCASAYGSGETPVARQQAFIEGMMRLLHGEQRNAQGQEG